MVRTIDDHAPDNCVPAAGESLAEEVRGQACVIDNLKKAYVLLLTVIVRITHTLLLQGFIQFLT